MPEFGRLPPDYLSVKVADKKIARKDADLILQFVNAEAARVGHTPHTVLSNTRYLSHTIEHIPNPGKWTNDTVNLYVSDVRGSGKANTQRKHIILTKSFCEWLFKSELNTLLKIPGIKEIKPTPASRMTKTAGQMLSTVEVDKIITAGKNTRDRCLLSVLSESGMRPFECLRLRWEELKIDDFGVIINVSGKTGAPRFIRLVHSSPYVAAWRNDHPSPTDTAFIFTSLKSPAASERITHSALKKILRLAVKRAGVKKASPYLLRHSSVTRMLEEGYSDSTIRMVHWGSQTTNMLGTYGHVSATAIDNEILGMAGIKNLEKKERKKIDQCPKCSMIVKPTDEFCPRCGTPITDVAIAQFNREKSLFDKDALEYLNKHFVRK
jgi:integrase